MTRVTARSATLAILASLSLGASAQAQYAYPPGYGGWGGWGNPSRVGGAAAGMGAYAAGAGSYNVQTAEARNVNAQTAMQFNDYVYECNTRNAKNYYARIAEKGKQTREDWTAIQDRILNNPTETDIVHGDALNAIRELLFNPKVYGKTLAAAKQPYPGTVVKSIPFAYNAAGITVSLGELISRENVPAVFSRPEFVEQRAALRTLVVQARKEAEEHGRPSPATLKSIRAGLDKAKQTLESAIGKDTTEGRDGEKYLKALYGVTRMLESPSLDVYLAAAGKQESISLSEVLQFMHAFNLKFGVATTPDQKEIYSQLYGALSELRQAVNPSPSDFAAIANAGPKSDQRPTEFFSQMDYNHMKPQAGGAPGAAPPPPPAARP